MVDEVKFLKTSIDFDVLLATTRNAVELYFEGPGIPVNLQEEDDIKSMSPICNYYISILIFIIHFSFIT